MNILEKRLQAGLTQQELSLKLGVRQNTVSQWENGNRVPSVEILPKLADVLNCTIDELVRGGSKDGK